MPPLEVRYRPEALADLEDIFRFVVRAGGARSSPDVMSNEFAIGAVVSASCRWRGGNGMIWRRVCARWRSSGAVIAYRVIGTTVEITNIFYSGRDYAALYRGQEPDESAC